jgi:hypothetical protein
MFETLAQHCATLASDLVLHAQLFFTTLFIKNYCFSGDAPRPPKGGANIKSPFRGFGGSFFFISFFPILSNSPLQLVLLGMEPILRKLSNF